MEFTLEELIQLKEGLQSNNFFSYRIFKAKNPNWYFRKFYRKYIKDELHSKLYYLENTRAKFQLKKIASKPKTILATLYPYFNQQTHTTLKKSSYKISRYACGKDYHNILKKKLTFVSKHIGNFRVVVDSTPFPERYYAKMANLGFIGKNGLLIHPKKGSYFFLSFVIFEKTIPKHLYQHLAFQEFIIQPQKIKNIQNDIETYCRDCNRCVDACPTNAISALGQVHTAQCISYQTIEAHVVDKMNIANQFQLTKKHKWIFGCDICQTVCPYNKKPEHTKDEHFQPLNITKMILNSTPKENQNTKLYNRQSLYGTPLKRIGIPGIIANKEKVDLAYHSNLRPKTKHI